MSTTRTRSRARALGGERPGTLPPLTTTDRLALRLGLALLFWGQRRADRRERSGTARCAENARRDRAAERAARSRDTAFEHRHHAGPTW